MSAVAPLGLPCYKGEYTGGASTYLVFNYSTVGVFYVDDTPSYEQQLVQLHLYCPSAHNTAVLREDIKRALVAAGFSYPSTEDASDKSRQHIVFEFEDVVPICADD